MPDALDHIPVRIEKSGLVFGGDYRMIEVEALEAHADRGKLADDLRTLGHIAQGRIRSRFVEHAQRGAR